MTGLARGRRAAALRSAASRAMGAARSLAAPILALAPALVRAHAAGEGDAVSAAALPRAGASLAAWTLDPLVLGLVAVSTTVYARGAVHLRRAGALRTADAAAFAAGQAAILAALVSPVDRLSERSFAVHMGQHELLMLVAAPLLVLSRPLAPLLLGLPRRLREPAVALSRRRRVTSAWRFLTSPAVAVLAHAAARWVWHLPLLFDAALASRRVHTAQHLFFFATAGVFWWALLHGRYGRAGYGMAVLAVFATTAHTGLLGAVIALAPSPLYRTYAARLGGGALADQQLAGLVMWVPTGALLTLVGLALFAAWLGEAERRARRESP